MVSDPPPGSLAVRTNRRKTGILGKNCARKKMATPANPMATPRLARGRRNKSKVGHSGAVG